MAIPVAFVGDKYAKKSPSKPVKQVSGGNPRLLNQAEFKDMQPLNTKIAEFEMQIIIGIFSVTGWGAFAVVLGMDVLEKKLAESLFNLARPVLNKRYK